MKRMGELNPTYDGCCADGAIKIRKEVDSELAKSLLKSALDGLERSKNLEKVNFEQKSKNYSFVFTERYDILRKLIDSFLLFDKVRISNHQCSNAYLCVNHPKLEIDWQILETARIIRNNINYKGRIVASELWKEYAFKFEIYIKALTNEVEKKLKEFV
ncbi:MAG: hypothetical protein KAK00_07915 [Nanoarchaeota archaeon]|nr:hypothetical protein [Nanoarchaeota archaeon]